MWESKVLRSASGAHFRIPIYASQQWNDIVSLLNSNANVFIADNNTIRDEISNKSTEETEDVEVIEDIEDSEDSLDEEDYLKTKKNSSHKIKFRSIRNLPVIPYFAVDYTENEVILVVGGETEGLSDNIFAIVKEKNGIRVNVPLNNGIESLNTAMAMGIIAFEVKRQFANLKNKVASCNSSSM